MTVYREVLMTGFRTATAAFGRSLCLRGPGGATAFDVARGARDSDEVRFYPVGIREDRGDSMLAVAADVASVVYSVAIEDLTDGREWIPDDRWTLEDYGPADNPHQTPDVFTVKTAVPAMDRMLVQVECVRKK
ncbi:MAG: hypothetical protein JSS51_03600 [Planctomycetes bacterium]|nr:hypothetical protein [Planctomycetota bacterium]